MTVSYPSGGSMADNRAIHGAYRRIVDAVCAGENHELFDLSPGVIGAFAGLNATEAATWLFWSMSDLLEADGELEVRDGPRLREAAARWAETNGGRPEVLATLLAEDGSGPEVGGPGPIGTWPTPGFAYGPRPPYPNRRVAPTA